MTISKNAAILMLWGRGAIGACASRNETAGKANDLVPVAGSSGAGGLGSGGGAAETKGGAAGNVAAGAGGTTAAGAGGESPVEPPGACPLGRGPEMVAIELPGVPRYCIDTTEVTQGQYATFLAASDRIDPKAQTRDFCRSYNASFVPPVKGDQKPGCPAGTYDPAKKAELPMSCVDLCDAVAFCEWSGKRLCGSISGGTLPKDAPSDSAQSQWYLACSQGGKTKYPYGDTFVAGKCDSRDLPKGETRPAETSACTGQTAPFDKIRDLSGSLSEWEDREGDSMGGFPVRGGYGWNPDDSSLACAENATTSGWGDGAAFAGTGFRCCSALAAP